jgi:hypothetical protein
VPRVVWPLQHGMPCVEVVLTVALSGQTIPRTLLADTGAGSSTATFQLILDEDDCLFCGGLPGASTTLGGAYVGSVPQYDLFVQIPALGFAQKLRVVGVSSVTAGFEGIAAFSFLNRFTYGNFGDPSQFGLEC